MQWHGAQLPSDAAYCAHGDATPAVPATKVLPAVHGVDRYSDARHVVVQSPHVPALPSTLKSPTTHTADTYFPAAHDVVAHGLHALFTPGANTKPAVHVADT